MDDIAPKLLGKIQKDFQTMFDKSEIISKLYAKVRDGTATYKEANDFAVEVGHILSKAYGQNLSSAVLPEGKMFYNIAQRIISPTMAHNYDLISEVTKEVQQSLNSKAGIGIKPMIPELNQDRINGIINRISGEDIFDKVKWILGEPVVNFSQSIVDDSIRVNAEFHGKAGMKPKIVRKIAGNCCEWCKAVAGKYSYPDVPKDVYRRHQRCRCTVDYVPGDGKVQNVHTKQWKEEKQEKILPQWMNQYDKAVVNEPEITEKVKEIAKKVEMDLYGLEYRIKSKQRYAEKLEKNISSGKKEINDILRYTMGTDNSDELADKIELAIEKLRNVGYNTSVLKNSWNDIENPYKGVNTIVIAPSNQKFELQYHTRESFETKERMHKLYEKWRVIEDKTSEKAIELSKEMMELSKELTIPNNIEKVK